jgi:hypothetical protein
MGGRAGAGRGLATGLEDIVPLDRAPYTMRHARPACGQVRQRRGDLVQERRAAARRSVRPTRPEPSLVSCSGVVDIAAPSTQGGLSDA